MAVSQNGSHFGRQSDDDRLTRPIATGSYVVFGDASLRACATVILVVHELDDLLGHAQGLCCLVLGPVGKGSLVVDATQDWQNDLGVVQAHAGGRGALQKLEDEVVHAIEVQVAQNLLLPSGLDADAGVLEAFEQAHDILPVVFGLALGDNGADVPAAIGLVAVAVDVLERQGHVAEGDFDGLRIELGAVLLEIDELLLLLGQVLGEQDLGVEVGEQLRQRGRRGLEEDGQGAACARSRARKGSRRATGECADGGGAPGGPHAASPY